MRRKQHHGLPGQSEGRGGRVVSDGLFAVVREERLAGNDLDEVVARSGIHPDGLLHGRANGDPIVPPKRIDNYDAEIALGRQETTNELLRDGLQIGKLFGQVGAVVLGRCAKPLEVQHDVVGVPDVVPCAVPCQEVQLDLGGEAVCPAPVGQAGHQVVIAQETGLRDVIN